MEVAVIRRTGTTSGAVSRRQRPAGREPAAITPLGALSVVLTGDCNLRCRYCYVRGGGGGVRPDASALECALDVLIPALEAGARVSLTGGEPLLAFNRLRTLVRRFEGRVAERGARFVLLTNGTLLSPARVAFLDEHGFEIRLSLDGVEASQVLRGANTFAPIDRLLDRLRTEHRSLFERRLTIVMVVAPTSVPYLAESIDYLLGKGVRSIVLWPAMGRLAWDLRRVGELETQFDTASRILRRHFDDSGEVVVSAFRRTASPEEAGARPRCGAPESGSVALDVDGRAYGCLLATRSYQRRSAAVFRGALDALRVGVVDDPGLPERLARMREAGARCGIFDHLERNYSSYRRCATCEFFGRCRICPLGAARDPGWPDVHRVSDFVCAFNQIATACRDRFPPQPTDHDILTGKAPLPSLVRGRLSPEGR